jgi:hypothetical protein
MLSGGRMTSPVRLSRRGLARPSHMKVMGCGPLMEPVSIRSNLHLPGEKSVRWTQGIL